MNIFDHINKRFVSVALGAIAIIAGLSWYLFYDAPAEPDGVVTEIGISPLEKTVGKDMLATLSKMKTTALDDSIFDDPVFRSLKDFGVEIASQPVGRRNPFGVFPSAGKPVKKPAAVGGGTSGAGGTAGRTTGGSAGGAAGSSASSRAVSLPPPSPEDIMLFDDFSF